MQMHDYILYDSNSVKPSDTIFEYESEQLSGSGYINVLEKKLATPIY